MRCWVSMSSDADVLRRAQEFIDVGFGVEYIAEALRRLGLDHLIARLSV